MGKTRRRQGHPAKQRPQGPHRPAVSRGSGSPAGGPRSIFDDSRIQPFDHLVNELNATRAKITDLQAQIERGEHRDVAALMDTMNAYVASAAEAYATLPTAVESAEAFNKRLPRELRRIRRDYIEASRHDPNAGKLEAVEIDGSAKRGAALGWFQAPLRDSSTLGYLQRRPDDCVRAALASLLQTAPHTVPDIGLAMLLAAGRDPEELERYVGLKLGVWLETNAVTLRAHPARLPLTSRRWIGIVGGGDEDPTGHCLLMDRRDVIFDTAWLVPPRKDEPPSWNSVDDVNVGLTIERR